MAISRVRLRNALGLSLIHISSPGLLQPSGTLRLAQRGPHGLDDTLTDSGEAESFDGQRLAASRDPLGESRIEAQDRELFLDVRHRAIQHDILHVPETQGLVFPLALVVGCLLYTSTASSAITPITSR